MTLDGGVVVGMVAVIVTVVGALIALAVAWGRTTKAIEEIAADLKERGDRHHHLQQVVSIHATRIAVLEDRAGVTPMPHDPYMRHGAPPRPTT